MANNCGFTMKVRGNYDSIYEFHDMLTRIGRVYHADMYDCMERTMDDCDAYYVGDCAWSVETAMMDRGIADVTKKLDLQIEIWSQECGCAFQEHIRIDCGNIVVNDTKEWESHPVESVYRDANQDESEDVDEYEMVAWYNREFGTNLNPDDIDEYGYIEVGGFSDYGHWSF